MTWQAASSVQTSALHIDTTASPMRAVEVSPVFAQVASRRNISLSLLQLSNKWRQQQTRRRRDGTFIKQTLLSPTEAQLFVSLSRDTVCHSQLNEALEKQLITARPVHFVPALLHYQKQRLLSNKGWCDSCGDTNWQHPQAVLKNRAAWTITLCSVVGMSGPFTTSVSAQRNCLYPKVWGFSLK